MLNIIFKKYSIILLPILLFGAFQQAVAQENSNALGAEVQAPIKEKHAKGRGGSGWAVGSSYTSTSLVAYAIRTSLADNSDTGKASSHNAAPSIIYRNKKHISYRFIVAQFDYSDSVSETKDTSSYDLDLSFALGNDTFITNLHPFGGRFYVALGLTDFELRAGFDGSGLGKGTDKASAEFAAASNGFVAEGDEIKFEVSGGAGGSLGYEGLGTYAGLGWGTKHPDKKGFGMRFELGVVQMPKPKANLYLENIGLTAEFRGQAINTEAINQAINDLVADTEEYERELEAEAAQLDIFPVIEIGISYHF